MIHSLLVLGQYILYWVYILQKGFQHFNLLLEILNFGVFALIVLCIQTNSHVFMIWFLWNLSQLFNFNTNVFFLSSICIGFFGSLSLRRAKGQIGGKSPEETANLEQLITFSWFNDLLDHGTAKALEMENIYNLMEKDSSKRNYERFKEIR